MNIDKKILYCFISHGSEIQSDKSIIKNMMRFLNYDNYIIVCGGEPTAKLEKNILYLDCDDSYAGLPEKINKLHKYIDEMLNIDYLAKLDRTITVKKLVDQNTIENKDYCGAVIQFINHPKTSSYHFNKCSKSSNWYEKPFIGKEIKYCIGGSYILSKKAIKIIAKDNSYSNHIYEDYYTASVLFDYGILPESINIKNYFDDINHPDIYK